MVQVVESKKTHKFSRVPEKLTAIENDTGYWVITNLKINFSYDWPLAV
jgi:hypothetical protein